MTTHKQRAMLSQLHFKPISLADREFFEQIVAPSNCRNCDMSFANIYGWSDIYHSCIAIYDNTLFIRFEIDGTIAYMAPIGQHPISDSIELLAADAALLGVPLRLFGLCGCQKEKIESSLSHHFALFQTDNHSDYIYNSSDLATLPGRRYQPKRNHINKFTSKYSYRFENITADNIQHCYDINNIWCQQKGVQNHEEEQIVLRKMLELFFELPFEGWILYANDAPCAFALGSKINHDTFCIHIEKSDATIEGSSAMINRLEAQALMDRYQFINREDDLGIEGLRRAKQSYHPVQMLTKHSALMLSQQMVEIKELWREVFGDDNATIDHFMVQLFDPALCFTHTEDGKIVSMLHLVPLVGEQQSVAYIYAVATAPEYRGRGIASSLIRKALDTIDRSERYHYTAIIPSSEQSAALYRKFGFEKSNSPFDFSQFEIDYDLGTGDKNMDIAMIRKK